MEYMDNTESVFEGDYQTWEDAEEQSAGYCDRNILEKVTESVQAVLRGDAEYERDSVLFFQKDLDYHIMAWLSLAAVYKGGGNSNVTVLDFGGSLGSTYLKNRERLQKMSANIMWYIVEQPHFVKRGKELFSDPGIRFEYSIDEIADKIDVVLFSGVIGYIKDPESILETVLKRKPQYIIFDRTLVGSRQRICIERVPEIIYVSARPVCIFDERYLLSLLSAEYYLECEFHSKVDKDVLFDDMKAISKGFVWRRKG